MFIFSSIGFEEGVELAFHELRKVGAGTVFGLGKECLRVLLTQVVQRGLFQAVALVMNRGAIRHPLRLLHPGLQSRHPRL